MVSLTPADKAQIPYFREIEEYYSMPDSICCYNAVVKLSVKENDGYLCKGDNAFVIVLVKENDEWLIGAIGAGSSYMNTRQGYGLITLTAKPTVIEVMDQNGYIATVPFDDVVFNATCNEIGNMGYNSNAIKANVMAVKMLAWWANAGHYRAAYGCDIMFGDIAYMSINNATTSGQTSIQNAMNAVDSYYMVSSSATGSKLFSTTYVAGTYSYTPSHASCGKLRQNESNYLAVEMDYTWEDILHFYFDNSIYNYPDVGTVQILGCNHNYGAYQHDSHDHWKICSICGESTVHESHDWVTFGHTRRCTICNYQYFIGGGVM